MRLWFLLTCLISASSAAENLDIAVAANFIKPVQIIAKDFEQATGHTITIHSGSTGQLYAQIIRGAPYQIFLSADKKRIDQLVKLGFANQSSQQTYACGQLALWAKNHIIKSGPKTASFKQLSKIALATPDTAPYGFAAEQVLNKTTTLNQAKRIYGHNVSASFQYAYSQAVDASFVAYSQLISKQIEAANTWIVPPKLYRPIKQDLVIIKSNKSKVAHQFHQYLLSEEVQKTIQQLGYLDTDSCTIN